VVRDSDRGQDALDDGGNGGVGVALNSGPGEVSAKTVGLDDGAVMGRSTDEGGGWDDESVGGSQANQEDGDLQFHLIVNKKVMLGSCKLKFESQCCKKLYEMISIDLRLAC
jgi:hypothetical protein